ncbi:mechanosensitive ion channel protein MscS [Nautilia sp. PV-1]|uniref:mechanosensitive ion channel family protein n=1 Tax=Nautilia sp. PV-1 TaxID=2579250 RepID=UPI000FD9A7E1|nr:mechanosensitive ion channel domain-containing protein [Nautilia sp. PV-1]AZV46183.1 mechanosensitive ion channel protein MscS [Nautilia sp. PV-1]
MRIIVFLLFFLSLFANTNDTNITAMKTKKQNIYELLKKDEFFINYQSYLNYKKLQNKIYTLEKLARKNPTKYKNKLDQLKTELELLSKNRNIFTTLIKIKELPKPPVVNNPFQIFNALNYEKEVDNVINENFKTYEYFKQTLNMLLQLDKLNKKLNIKDSELKQTIQDFIVINNIYKTKLKTLEAESKIYKQKVKKEINKEINKLISLVISIAISIFIFMLIKLAVRKYVKEESFYLTNKILNFINATVILIIISFFYINNATYLITIVGFASAGIAIAMKDWFMNIFGWFVIMTSGNFKVGDRIKIYLQNGQVRIVGDVIDITMTRIVIYEDVTLTTYLYNRRAGRIVFIPNNIIFTNPVFNYTHHGMSTVWDGIDITITFDSNHKKAVYLAKEIVSKYSKGYTDITKRRLQKLKSEYHIKNANVEPRIYTFIEDNGIRISCWYLNNYTPLNLRSNISAEIIEAFNNEEDITIAYPTYTIVKRGEHEEPDKTETPV